VLPGHHPLHDLPGFWLQEVDAPEAVILDEKQIAAHNRQVRALHSGSFPSGRWDLRQLKLQMTRIQAKWEADLRALEQAVTEGKRVLAGGKKPDALLRQLQREVAAAKPADELRVVRREAPLRCYPTPEGFYENAWLLAFDLAQCAELRPGEPVRVMGKARTHWYVWSTYAHGWVLPDALTPPLSEAQAAGYLSPERFVVVQRDRVALWADRSGKGLLTMARLGTRLPLEEQTPTALRVTAPGSSGLTSAWLLTPEAVSIDGYPPLTHQHVLERAFGLLDSPYGWGGMGGHRDCSRFLMDLFAAFGLELPRNSRNQSEAGTRRVELEKLDESAKTEAIQQAARQGVVLLYLPGHIMLYVGRDNDRLHALHEFSGYLVPCRGAGGKERGAGETMVRVNRAAVTSLELGRGSSRSAFIERVTRLVLLAPPEHADAH